MKAMIFAAGLGTRLRPITNDCPKALVEVKGITMLERVIARLKSSGVDEIVVNIHHFGKKIKDFIEAKSSFGVKIDISDECDSLLDTGGGMLKARRWLDGNEPFIIHNVDILTNVDLGAMVECHVANNADVTLLVAERPTTRYLMFDEQHQLNGWVNVKTGEVLPQDYMQLPRHKPMAFGGVHIVSPSIFDALATYSPTPKFSIIPFYIENCQSLKIIGYTPKEPYYWYDVGNPATLAEAESSI